MRTLYDVQPQSWPSVSASSSVNSPVAMARKPHTSKRPERTPGNFGSTISAATNPTTPTGTLMKKISRQSTYSTR